MLHRIVFIQAALALIAMRTLPAAGQTALGNAFTYQGQLKVNGSPANGTFDFELRLFDASTNGSQLGAASCADAVAISNGLFTVSPDFGAAVFNGNARWLEISVRADNTPGNCFFGPALATLSPRQLLRATPNALYAASGNATTLSAQPSSFYQNAANLTGGTLSDARLSANVALRNSTNTFTATNIFQSSVGIGASPAAPLDLLGTAETMLQINSSNTGGSWLTLRNSGTGGRAWNLISSGFDNGEGAGKLLFRDANANAVRMTIDTSGRVGIGTTFPAAPLDVQVAAGQTFQFRQDQGVPGINVNSTGGIAGIMRLRNTIEVWPSDDATRPGKIDIRNTAGGPTITLDGASGNGTFAGSLSANNLPGVEFSQAHITNNQYSQLVGGASTDFDVVSMDLPASGYVIVAAFIHVCSADDFDFNLYNVTSGQYLTTTKVTRSDVLVLDDVMHLTWTVPVSAGNTTLKVNGQNHSVHTLYYKDHSLTAIFVPVRY